MLNEIIKCGEVYGILNNNFRISCNFCSAFLELEKFSKHFQSKHLNQLHKNTNESQQICIKSQTQPPTKEEPINTFENGDNNLKEYFEFVEDFGESQFIDDEFQSEGIAAALPEKEESKNANELKIQVMPRSLAASAKPLTTLPLAVQSTKTTLEPTTSSAAVFFQTDEDKEADAETTDGDSCISLFKPYPCAECEKSYKTKIRRQEHRLKFHHKRKVRVEDNADNNTVKDEENEKNKQEELEDASDDSLSSEDKTKKKEGEKQSYSCDRCDQVFRCERSLTTHKYKHTGIICEVCGRRFKYVSYLREHQIRHTGNKNFKCQQCERNFFTSQELNAHMIQHTGIRPFFCEICGRKCRDSGILKLHMRRHTGERPAKCKVCGKCFYSAHDLNVHSVTHTKIRSFLCDICGSSFLHKKQLRLHKRTHLDVPYLQCEFCKKGFIIASALRKHMRNVHGDEQTVEQTME